MNHRNFEFLKDTLKFMGFKEQLNIALENQLKLNYSVIQLYYSSEINKKKLDATLNLKKSDIADIYFFNNYHAFLKLGNGEIRDQIFYLNKGKGVTVKEAYNLLDGRAVYKKLSTKIGNWNKAWIQLDFTKKDKNNNYEINKYYENYGYDLKKVVSSYSILEIDNNEKLCRLLQSLEKGNIQQVSMIIDGMITNLFIEANPRYKTINLYDLQMNKIQKDIIGSFLKGENLEKLK